MQGVFAFYKDLPARPRRPERLFFGVFPDPEAAAHIARFGRRFVLRNQLKGSLLRPDRLHVSLHHVGDYKRLRTKIVYAARQAGNGVLGYPFEMTFRSLRSFEGAPAVGGRPCRRPLVLLGDDDHVLSELHRSLGSAMVRNGLRPTTHFTPHLTMFYGSKQIPLQAIEPIRFTVKEVTLVHSMLWLSRYNILGRWPLDGG